MAKRKRKRRPTENSGRTVGKTKTGRVENLKPFKPGQSGNPGGRPKDLVACEMRDLLLRPCPLDKKKRSWGQVIAEAIGKKARKGDIRAFEAIADRTDGKPAQAVSVSGEFSGGFTVDSYTLASREAVQKRIEELNERFRARRENANKENPR
jgi:hypothetical protein